MGRRFHLILTLLFVFVLAFLLVVSLNSVSTAQGSMPFGDDPPGRGEKPEFEMAPGTCCQMLIADSNGGPPKAVFGVWTGSSCSCDGSAFAGSPCAFVCP